MAFFKCEYSDKNKKSGDSDKLEECRALRCLPSCDVKWRIVWSRYTKNTSTAFPEINFKISECCCELQAFWICQPQLETFLRYLHFCSPLCDIFNSAARSIRFMTKINVFSAAEDLSTTRSKSMPSYLRPNPSVWWLNQCLLWWGQLYALPDRVQCLPSWKNLSTTWQESVPPLMGQAPFSSWLRSVPPLLELNPSLYKTSISLEVKIVFIVVDSGFLAVPCPFVSGSLVPSTFPLISSFN